MLHAVCHSHQTNKTNTLQKFIWVFEICFSYEVFWSIINNWKFWNVATIVIWTVRTFGIFLTQSFFYLWDIWTKFDYVCTCTLLLLDCKEIFTFPFGTSGLKKIYFPFDSNNCNSPTQGFKKHFRCWDRDLWTTGALKLNVVPKKGVNLASKGLSFIFLSTFNKKRLWMVIRL